MTDNPASPENAETISDGSEKLQKVLAREGLGSRRALEARIAAGQVRVNGQVARLGDRVKLGDSIEFEGQKIRVKAQAADALRVILYNKPEGEICSRNDPEGRPSVFDRLPRLREGRWVQVGRLDINTTGLLLFTNSGDLANALMHPSNEIDREYLVRVRGEVSDDMLDRLRAGVELEDGLAKFTDIVESPNNDEKAHHHWYYCVVMEGRNREVRRLWESQGVQINRLKRVRYGNIFIPSHVRVGQWVELSDKELAELCATAGLPAPPKRNFKQRILEQRERQIKKLRSGSRGRRRN